MKMVVKAKTIFHLHLSNEEYTHVHENTDIHDQFTLLNPLPIWITNYGHIIEKRTSFCLMSFLFVEKARIFVQL